ncbi:MAG: PilW family protein [Pseudomonadota bacterium]
MSARPYGGGESSREEGFTLVEFMVSLVLGAVLISGAVSVYLASSRAYQETESSIGLADNGRFALQFINDALRRAGFFAGVSIQDVVTDSNLGAVGSDCTGRGAAYDIDNYLFAAAADGSGNLFGCITDAVPGSDVLVVKALRAAPLYDADPNNAAAARDGAISYPSAMDAQTTYVVASTENAMLLDGADAAPDVSDGKLYAKAAAWPYSFQAFYVRSGAIPSLVRKTLAWDSGAGGMVVTTEELVQGVEQIRFRFGWDGNDDGEIDQFGSHSAVGSNWDAVGVIETYMLLRSINADYSYDNVKTYTLGDVSVTASDNYWRLLVNSSITMRNPSLYIRG